MKKIYALLLGIVCAFALAVSAFADCETYKGNNRNTQNYSTWANTVKSYLHICDDDSLMRVQYLTAENKLLVEYYNDSFECISQKLISPEFPVFGGFYATDDSYFLLTGQNNLSESADVTCFAVTKYDKSWNKLATAELKDCNTTVPFDAGSARFCHSGNYLLIRTSHEMYKSSDGLNHQANVTIQLDMNTMKITDSLTQVLNNNYGYVSHSFNQFIKTDSDKIVALDHGDAYPRSIALTKYKTSVSSGKFTPAYYQPCSVVDMLSISGATGDNYTGCSVGGFEVTSSGYLAAFNSVNQKSSSSSVRNIYLSYCDKNSETPVLRQITDYASSGASTPQLVKAANSRFIVMWYYDGRVHYCEADDKGNLRSDIMSFEGCLSDCQPIVYQNKLLWYVWKDSKVDFYTVSLSDIRDTQCISSVSGHKYESVSVSGTDVSLRCEECGDRASGKLPSDFSLWWEDLSLSSGNTVYYNSAVEASYHPGETISLTVKFSEADLNEYEVVSDNERVAVITEKYDGPAVMLKGEGTAKITVRSVYNREIKKTYTIKVSHSWKTKENTSATCERDGKAVEVCSICGESRTEIVPATGHKMSGFKVTKEASCKATGEKKSTCSVCSYSVTEKIPKKDHDSKVTLGAVAATCTKQGKTQGKKCSLCGAVTVAQETVEALGHSLGKYKVTKKPTCTAQGEETAECSRCSYTKTQSVARLSHTEVTVKATAPTCTKSGKTEGKKCSVCGRITVEQETVEALGHSLGSYKITKKPTCTAQGEETAECSRCSYTKTQSVPRLSHTQVTVKATAPTCTKSGKTEGKKCSVCGRITVEQETVEALGHELGAYEITKEPTCTAKGEKTAECIRCSYTKTADVAKTAHTEKTIKAIAPTCTKSGKTEGKKCLVCGSITAEQETVEALGHELGTYEITKESTCTTKGEKTAKCIRCSYTKTADVAKIPHTEVTLKAKAPTCTKSGKTDGKKCSVCGAVTVAQETVEALGHSKKVVVLAVATTDANGKINTVCEICGEDFGEQRVYRIKSLSLSSTKCTYNGKSKTPSVKVVDYNKDTLIKDRDYTVIYENSRKDIGKYSVVINFIGKYSGSETLYYEILPGKTSKITATQSTSVIKLKWEAVKGANGYRVYRYDSKTAEYKQIASIKNKTEYRVTGLKAGKDYKFAVLAYFKSADGKVYFSESKSAVATATEPTVPSVSLKLSGKTAVLAWNKISGADGYQIYYSTSKNGSYKKLKSTSALSFKKTGLKSGKKYYFKVRAYKKTSSGTVFGEFSKVHSGKIK
ncbi:MAG: fibronectin type III domain-containing protein [Clostridia bacterium]|nr:fibronectin type III domain-containing protein [Clostridia bacterium]